METDVVYFTRRAKEERVAAVKATNRLARQSHLEMAERFELLAAAIAAQEKELGLHLVTGIVS